MSELTTLAEIKEQLNITGTAHDTRLAALADRLEAMLLRYIQVDGADDAYVALGEGGLLALGQVLLVMCVVQYENPEADPFSPAVRAMLRLAGIRTPTLSDAGE